MQMLSESSLIFLMEVQNLANELIYLLRAKFFLWWWRVCQSEERGGCRPPTSNLGKDRTTEMSRVKPTRNNMRCWFLENCVCRWFLFFLGKQCYEKIHIVNTEKTVVWASPGWGLHLVIMAAGWFKICLLFYCMFRTLGQNHLSFNYLRSGLT